MSFDQEFVVIARIVCPQGRRGEVLADILTDFPEKFAERKKLFLSAEGSSNRRECTLQEHWLHKGRVVLKFSGVNSITDAEALIGTLVEIPKQNRSQLEPGSIYVSELVGSIVVDFSGNQRREIGTVEKVQQGIGATPLLVVRSTAQEYEIPFAEEYIVRFNPSEKMLEMKLPEGMLEVNSPLSEDEKRQQHGKK